MVCIGVSYEFGLNQEKSTHRFIGLTMGALLMEFNSIFLHARTLMLYTGKRETFQFKCVSIANIISLIIFRLYVSVFT